MKKILVIINKNWETEPVLNALTNPKLRPAALPFPDLINTPCEPAPCHLLPFPHHRPSQPFQRGRDRHAELRVSLQRRPCTGRTALRAGGIRRGTANMIIEIIRNIY